MRVKFRSRLLTALNLLPSIATLASVQKPSVRQSSTNRAQTSRMARPLSLRKSAIVLWPGARELQQNRWIMRRPARDLGIDAVETEPPEIQLIDKHVDHPNRVLLTNPILQAFRQ